MSVITVGAVQLGPIARSESRAAVVKRLVAHMQEAQARGCDLVVFPELALTPFFPRWSMPDQAEVDAFFEREMPGPETPPLFEEARRRVRALAAVPAPGEVLLRRGRSRLRRLAPAGRTDRPVHLQRPPLARDLPGHGPAGVEMVLLGYNTPVHNPPAPAHDLLANFAPD